MRDDVARRIREPEVGAVLRGVVVVAESETPFGQFHERLEIRKRRRAGVARKRQRRLLGHRQRRRG